VGPVGLARRVGLVWMDLAVRVGLVARVGPARSGHMRPVWMALAGRAALVGPAWMGVVGRAALVGVGPVVLAGLAAPADLAAPAMAGPVGLACADPQIPDLGSTPDRSWLAA
jgi:hypothetical protein